MFTKRVVLALPLMTLGCWLFPFTSTVNAVVTSPRGGEILQKESSHNITWTTGRYRHVRVDIKLYKAEQLIETIVSDTRNDGKFDWQIPSGLPDGDDYKIFITYSRWWYWSDSSSDYFSIISPPADDPPADDPPYVNPPADDPPADDPPADDPPADDPPADDPPAEEPPAEEPPIDPLPLGWAEFTQSDQALFTGQYGIASDPSIIKEGQSYRMVYTGLDVYKTRTIICSATSTDGFNWQNVPVNNSLAGTIMQGVDNSYYESLEAACIYNVDGRYLIWYSGYQDEAVAPLYIKGYPSAMYLAASDDGVNYDLVNDTPIITPDYNWYDCDAVYSPSVIQYGGGYLMIYCGHSYSGSDYSIMGVHLLAATSPDGYVWEKQDQRVLGPQANPYWMGDGAAEPCLIEHEGVYYLFFTGLDNEDRVIGVARSSSPYGPWDINPDPIIVPRSRTFCNSGVFAPTVLIENNKARVWFLGHSLSDYWVTGYAEAPLPLYN